MKARYTILGSLIGVCAVAAQTPAPLDATLPGRLAAAFKKSGAPSVSVAVVQAGKLAFAQTLGMADLAAGRKADGNTRYPVGSISKQFTAAALLLLEEQGKLSLEDRVSKYFPDLTRAGDVSIRQLLSHTSGYEDYAPQDYLIPEWVQPTTPQAVLNQWARKPLNFEPGTKWQYSNTNYVLAASIFEKAAGQNLVVFLRERVFQPLGMQSAGDCLPVLPADPVAYTRYALGSPRPVAREGSGWYWGAGELCMTPSDLARWDIAFLEKRILSAQSYEEFTREVKLANGDSTHYALGLQILELNSIPMVAHGGEVSGFLAANYVFPSHNSAVVAFSNEDGIRFVDPLARDIAATLLQTAPARPAAASEQDTKQVRAILEDLQKGRTDRALFTANANSYFSEAGLADFKSSLSAIGKLKSVSRTSEESRGGMTHRGYRAEFSKKTVVLNIYVMPDGKYEQFMVEDQI
jgi:D-alanyl-D-alanine carboxypeptidase